MKTAQLYFTHDLEDGWYVLLCPDGSRKDFNHFEDVLPYCNSQEFNVVWGSKDVWYMPEYFKNKQMSLMV